jgi:hypothetical protein
MPYFPGKPTFTASLLEGRRASMFTSTVEGPQCPPYWAVVAGGVVVLEVDDNGRPLTEESATRIASEMSAHRANEEEFYGSGDYD